jgi:hypothetical protein
MVHIYRTWGNIEKKDYLSKLFDMGKLIWQDFSISKSSTIF